MKMNYVAESYEKYKEEDRLTTNNARKIEFLTTVRAFHEHFPETGKLLDCAAGAGIYSFYFDDRGYDATALDLTPRHIKLIGERIQATNSSMKAAVNDACNLSRYDDNTFDVVLCMGPIYHITDPALRQKCLDECKRVLKPGGFIAVAYVNRFFVFPYVAVSDRKYMQLTLGKKLLETGTLLHDDPNCFWTDTYYATPEEMERIFDEMRLMTVDHLTPDGISPLIHDKVDALSEEEFQIWCDYHYLTCREKSILGAGNHGLIIGRKS